MREKVASGHILKTKDIARGSLVDCRARDLVTPVFPLAQEGETTSSEGGMLPERKEHGGALTV